MKEAILSWMYKLASVPRGSHHEEAVSCLLKNEIEKLGYSATQDAVFNVFAEIPATPGKENAPSVILQAHMDMVIAVREGERFDPLADTPVLYEDNGLLSSRGITSIGADDGIGIALAMALISSDAPHGPIKLLFTADEEDGMSGATHVDEKWLEADYLVNLDWEEFGSVCNSCAGCRGYNISYEPVYEGAPPNSKTLSIAASGFRGGHSGITIGEGRDNAILVLARILSKLKEENIDFRIISMDGGSARNAIPSYANVNICVTDAAEKIKELIDRIKNEFYKEEAQVCVSVLNSADKVATCESTEAFINFISSVPNGVYSMSKVIDGLVECSSNLGLVHCDADVWLIDIFARSSSYEKEAELEASVNNTANTFGWSLALNQSAPGWPVNPESKLLPILLASYKELFKKEMKVEPVHAGLECGWFVIKNKSLDCVSFGPTLYEVHTPNEALDVDSAVHCLTLLKELLGRI